MDNRRVPVSRNTRQSTALRLASRYKTDTDLVLELLELIGLEETKKTLQMTPEQLRQTARVNLAQISRKEAIDNLLEENIVAKPIPELPEGIEIFKGSRKLGSSLAYLKGEVMPQGLASMLTVDALDPQQGEIILDMAAAPGGKSCFIAERLRGSGLLLANDVSKTRIRALQFNLARHHISNAVILQEDARNLSINKLGKLDRILLDAPCSGGGLLVSKPDRKYSKSITNSIQLHHLQLDLVTQALSLLQSGGVLVYATCAISPLENEEVIKPILNKVKLTPLNIIGNQGGVGNLQFQHAKRLYPSIHRCDGFFIVRMEKI